MKGRAKPKRGGRILRLGVLCVVSYLFVMIIAAQADLRGQQRKLAELQARIEAQQQINDEALRVLAADDEEERAERIAREKLGHVMPDEKVYIDMSGK